MAPPVECPRCRQTVNLSEATILKISANGRRGEQWICVPCAEAARRALSEFFGYDVLVDDPPARRS